jgi:hypothetical protein
MVDKYITFKLLVVACLFCSCGINQNEQREIYMEKIIVDSIERNVEDERNGYPLYSSHRSWNDYWKVRIRNMRRTHDGEKYVKMVIEMRRSEGLPELR